MVARVPTAWFCWVLVLGSTVVAANDWPHWRGPSATGIAAPSPLPSAWSANENVAWQAALEGSGVSSPIVSGNRVFVTSQAGDGRRRAGNHPTLTQGGDPKLAGELTLQRRSRTDVAFIVEAFDRSSGKRLWMHETKPEGELPPVHDKHNLSSASPVTDGERVYGWFGTGQLVALDNSGKTVWSKNLATEYGAFDIQWGHASSPVLFEDSIILLCYHSPASYIVALDKRTGAVKWKTDKPAGQESYSSPIVVAGPGGNELIVNAATGVESFDASTGKSLWNYPEVNRFPIPVSMVDNGILYLSRGYRSSPFMAIRPGGKGDVGASHVLWKAASGAPYVSSLIHYDGLIYMVGDVGVLTVADAKTGERVHQERVGGVYTASPVAADGRIYLISEDGETIVLAAGRTPRILSRNRLNARQLASPAIAGGRLFIRSDDALYAIGK